MAALDLSSLKAYVSGGAARSLSASTALLDVEHSLIEQRFVEIPFDLAWTAVEVKEKLQQLSGTPVEHQRVHVGGASGPLLDPPHATLASFGVRGGGAGGVRLLFVRDVDPFALGRGGGLHDVSQVTKYVMSDEEYRKRDNTYRAFKERQRALDPSWRSVYEQKQGGGGGGGGARKGAAVQGQPASAASEESEEELRKRIPLQARCQIIPGERRGIVRCQPQTHHTAALTQPCTRSTSTSACHHSTRPSSFSPVLCGCHQMWVRCPSCACPLLLRPPLCLCGLGWSWTSRWVNTEEWQAGLVVVGTSTAGTSTAPSSEPAACRSDTSLRGTHLRRRTTTLGRVQRRMSRGWRGATMERHCPLLLRQPRALMEARICMRKYSEQDVWC